MSSNRGSEGFWNRWYWILPLNWPSTHLEVRIAEERHLRDFTRNSFSNETKLLPRLFSESTIPNLASATIPVYLVPRKGDRLFQSWQRRQSPYTWYPGKVISTSSPGVYQLISNKCTENLIREVFGSTHSKSGIDDQPPEIWCIGVWTWTTSPSVSQFISSKISKILLGRFSVALIPDLASTTTPRIPDAQEPRHRRLFRDFSLKFHTSEPNIALWYIHECELVTWGTRKTSLGPVMLESQRIPE